MANMWHTTRQVYTAQEGPLTMNFDLYARSHEHVCFEMAANRRHRLKKVEADLVQKLDETLQEMRAQVKEHFESLSSPTGASTSVYNSPGNKAWHTNTGSCRIFCVSSRCYC